MNPRRKLERLAQLPDEEISLSEGALWIAAESRPDLDVPGCLARLHALAEKLRPGIASRLSQRAKIEALNEGLFNSEGYSGNSSDYSNPQNSDLDRVLETRLGIPITLSILYVDIANRLDLRCRGVGFPGHFLVKAFPDETEVLIDPFAGQTVDIADCKARLARATKGRVAFQSQMLDATPSKEILQRLLRNLKLIYLRNKNYETALGCSERILLLAGDDLSELRDRALIYRELDCAGAALADLDRYLAFKPRDPQAAALSGLAEALRKEAPTLN
ncbi:MAG: tetratricopeptide repeat protein [Myxococcota bacterium]|jgi:regulator of sirC expression with transglutaminase-like and TPR domain|nr:tetratricopeptide repeat protein [Myxococcota bacterium]